MLRRLGIDKKTVISKKQKGNQEQLQQQLHSSLGAGDLRKAVTLPVDEDIDEWLAVNGIYKFYERNVKMIVIDFFNGINLLYGGISEFCSRKSCPTMSAGQHYEYLWADGIKVKKPIKVSAPEYVEYLMDWVQSLIEDDTVFPTDDKPFPKKYKDIVKNIMKRLFRVYAHVYYNHAEHVALLGIEAHLNTSFSHFYLFIREFDLVDPKEMAPLQSVIDKVDEKYPRVVKSNPRYVSPRNSTNFVTMLVRDRSQHSTVNNNNDSGQQPTNDTEQPKPNTVSVSPSRND